MPMPMRVLTMNARATKTGRKDAREPCRARREDANAPPMALRADTELTAGARRATRAELAMADMVRIDAKVRATRYAAIFLFMCEARLTQRQLTRIRAEAFCHWARICGIDMCIQSQGK